MNQFLQILCYAISFLFLLWFGCFFGFISDQYVTTLQNDLPGKPLPLSTQFLIQNPLAIPYLVLLPWLIFVGFPLLPYVRRPYWEPDLFLLRLSAFIPAVLLICWILIYSYVAPFIAIYGGMSDTVPPLTPVEFWARGAFWCLAVLIVVGLLWRVTKRQK